MIVADAVVAFLMQGGKSLLVITARHGSEIDAERSSFFSTSSAARAPAALGDGRATAICQVGGPRGGTNAFLSTNTQTPRQLRG